VSFIETPRFPDVLALNAQRRRITSTDIVQLASGHEQRTARWSQKRRRFDVGVAIRRESDYAEVLEWFEALGGPLTGFRFTDPHDYEVSHSTGVLTDAAGTGAAGAGYGVPTYQLWRKYARGTAVHYRQIAKPRSTPFEIKRGGVAVTLGAGAGQAALATTTGVVTFVADQSRAVSSHSVGATHEVTLASAFSPNLSVGQRVYVSGVSGTAASLLNGLSHAVTYVSSAVVRVATVTTGLTATGGTAALYPQATETLTWAGEFDIPVRFESDELDDLIVQTLPNGEKLLQAPSIVLVEIRT
jgi:uncharacterized protein (TIGR02217 family)